MKAAIGRVVVEKLPSIDEKDGFTIPDAEKNTFGIITSLGDPEPGLFTEEQIDAFLSSGLHPCPYKVGDKVLLPKMTGKVFEVEGKESYVFWQSDIEVYENSVE